MELSRIILILSIVSSICSFLLFIYSFIRKLIDNKKLQKELSSYQGKNLSYSTANYLIGKQNRIVGFKLAVISFLICYAGFTWYASGIDNKYMLQIIFTGIAILFWILVLMYYLRDDDDSKLASSIIAVIITLIPIIYLSWILIGYEKTFGSWITSKTFLLGFSGFISFFSFIAWLKSKHEYFLAIIICIALTILGFYFIRAITKVKIGPTVETIKVKGKVLTVVHLKKYQEKYSFDNPFLHGIQKAPNTWKVVRDFGDSNSGYKAPVFNYYIQNPETGEWAKTEFISEN